MNIPTTILSALFISLSIVVYAQDTGPVSEMYLKGKWKAECAIEVADQASIQNCQLCPFVIDPSDKSSASIKDVELTFDADSLTLNQNGSVTQVPYTRNGDTHSFSFVLNKKKFTFRVFFYNKQRIIEDGDGLLVVLTKMD